VIFHPPARPQFLVECCMEKSVYTIAKILGRFIKNDRVRIVVEVGAKDCTESVGLAERFPQARVYAFECNPDTLDTCRRNVRDHPQIQLIESAVADSCGIRSFFKTDPVQSRTLWPDGNPGASSLFRASGKYPVEDYAQIEVSVPTTTLEKFVNDRKLQTIDLLWMDIQGSELLALKGLGDSLSKVKLIHTEVEFLEIYKGQPLWRDLNRFLHSKNFALLKFTSFGRYSADAIFINRKFHEGAPWPTSLIYFFHLSRHFLRASARRINRCRGLAAK